STSSAPASRGTRWWLTPRVTCSGSGTLGSSWRMAAVRAARTVRAYGSSASPAAVRRVPPAVRCVSGTSESFCSAAMRRLTEDWPMPSASAAALSLPASATARRVRRSSASGSSAMPALCAMGIRRRLTDTPMGYYPARVSARERRDRTMYFKQFYDTDLAQGGYLIGCQANGEAIVVDARRDIHVYLDEAEAQGLRITAVTETHIHADYLSGSRELAAATGAKLYLSDEGGPDWSYAFDHEPLLD